MYKNWKNGIPCHLFRKERMDDLNLMIEIDNAINSIKKRHNEMQSMLNKIGGL